MRPLFAAALEFQAPKSGYRDPAPLEGREVCCHCKREVIHHTFTAQDGRPVTTHHCPQCGDVKPMRSVVIHPDSGR